MTSSTLRNLKRKEDLIDYEVRLHPDGYPLPAWIELSPTDLCNRKCVFCPKSDPVHYPNRKLHMVPEIYERLARELENITYCGTVVLAGYGEPLLSPHLMDMVMCLSRAARVELVTNGDHMSIWDRNYAALLYRMGLSMFVVNMYDGPQQEERFHQLFRGAGIPDDHYLLRDRWHGPEQDYGIKLTNRAGVVTIGNQAPIVPDKICHYPAYSMMIDWDGEVRVCAQDWHRKISLGNINKESLLDIWTSAKAREYRMALAHGRRGLDPCAGCNADGTLHGAGHAEAWVRYYARGAS